MKEALIQRRVKTSKQIVRTPDECYGSVRGCFEDPALTSAARAKLRSGKPISATCPIINSLIQLDADGRCQNSDCSHHDPKLMIADLVIQEVSNQVV